MGWAEHIALDAMIREQIVQPVALSRRFVDKNDSIRTMFSREILQRVDHRETAFYIVRAQLLLGFALVNRVLQQHGTVVQIMDEVKGAKIERLGMVTGPKMETIEADNIGTSP